MMIRHLLIGLLACGTWLQIHAQQSLSDLVSQAKAEWMFGKWEATTDNGGTFSLNISWDLDKHVVQLHVKSAEIEAKGYSVVDPDSSEVKYFGFDNRGSVSKGAWGLEKEELVLRTESQTPDRGARKSAFVFAGSSSAGLEVRMHAVDSSGNLSGEARTTLKFKKQK